MRALTPIQIGTPIEVKILDEAWTCLDSLAKRIDDTSQFGESTLLAAIIAKIGALNQWCFECGAGEPEWCSNTKLFRDQQWTSVLIEKDPENAKRLRSRAGPWSIVIEREVADLDQALKDVKCPWCRSRFPWHPDIGIIDVDGQDWWLWRRFCVYTPRIMMVECCLHDDTAPPPEEDGKGQAGEHAIIALGHQKNYVPICRTPCNVIFIAKNLPPSTNGDRPWR